MAEESTTPDLVEQLVRCMSVAYNRRDYDMLCKLVTPDVVYRPISTFAESEECRGPEEYFRFLEGFWEAWADDATWHLHTIRLYGDAVIGLHSSSGRAKTSGIEMSGGVFVLDRFRDGKIASIEDFTDRDDAIKAAEERG